MRGTQTSRLYAYLMTGRTITSLEAFQKLGISRLAARIYDLKDLGYDVESNSIMVSNRFGEECRVTEYSCFPL